MKKILSLIGLVAFLFGCSSTKPTPSVATNNEGDVNSLLWKVSGNGLQSPSYLYGTFHIMCKEDILFSNNLIAALNGSQKLYLEMDFDDPANMMALMGSMNMKGGKKLKDLYSGEEFAKLEKFFKDSVGFDLNMMPGMKPFFLQAVVYPKAMSCKQTSGVDMELLKMAKDAKIGVKGLETAAFQASLFDKMSYDEQAKDLYKMVDSFSVYKKQFMEMYQLYKNQQLGDLGTAMTKDDASLTNHMDDLLYNRNADWVTKLKEILPKENVFVAVGAAHLIGSKGLIQLLRNEGFTVTAVAK